MDDGRRAGACEGIRGSCGGSQNNRASRHPNRDECCQRRTTARGADVPVQPDPNPHRRLCLLHLCPAISSARFFSAGVSHTPVINSGRQQPHAEGIGTRGALRDIRPARIHSFSSSGVSRTLHDHAVGGIAATSRYKLAALAFDEHISPLIRRVLTYFPGDQNFDGISFSTTVRPRTKPGAAAAKALSVEFFFSLEDLRRYQSYDYTGSNSSMTESC